jgi:hypothetical protein
MLPRRGVKARKATAGDMARASECGLSPTRFSSVSSRCWARIPVFSPPSVKLLAANEGRPGPLPAGARARRPAGTSHRPVGRRVWRKLGFAGVVAGRTSKYRRGPAQRKHLVRNLRRLEDLPRSQPGSPEASSVLGAFSASPQSSRSRLSSVRLSLRRSPSASHCISRGNGLQFFHE